VVRARVTVGGGALAGAIRDVSREGGARAFYRGLGPTLAAVVPFVAVQNAAIDLGKAATDDGAPPSYARLCAVGAGAGVLAQTVTYPLDVLRRRLQIGGLAAGGVVAVPPAGVFFSEIRHARDQKFAGPDVARGRADDPCGGRPVALRGHRADLREGRPRGRDRRDGLRVDERAFQGGERARGGGLTRRVFCVFKRGWAGPWRRP